MKISYPILAVLLDGQPHSEDEIVRRVRYFVPPEQAVRAVAKSINLSRADSRKYHKTNRQIGTRLPDADPSGINPDDAVRRLIVRTLLSMRRCRHGYDWVLAVLGNGDGRSWQLVPDYRNLFRKHKMTTSGVALAIRESLLLRGEPI